MFSDILTPLPALGIEFDVIKGKGPRIDNPIDRWGGAGACRGCRAAHGAPRRVALCCGAMASAMPTGLGGRQGRRPGAAHLSAAPSAPGCRPAACCCPLRHRAAALPHAAAPPQHGRRARAAAHGRPPGPPALCARDAVHAAPRDRRLRRHAAGLHRHALDPGRLQRGGAPPAEPRAGRWRVAPGAALPCRRRRWREGCGQRRLPARRTCWQASHLPPAPVWHSNPPCVPTPACPQGKADRNCRRTKMMMFNNPAVLHTLLEHLTEALIAYVGYQIEAGAQVRPLAGWEQQSRVGLQGAERTRVSCCCMAPALLAHALPRCRRHTHQACPLPCASTTAAPDRRRWSSCLTRGRTTSAPSSLPSSACPTRSASSPR